MNAVLTKCSHCGAQYRVKSEYVGKKARCSKCGDSFIISRVEEGAGTGAREPDSPTLVACPYCGFQDFGNFCSNCGGRLTGEPMIDFERCKVPQTYLARFPASLSYELDAPPEKREEEQRRYEIRQHCERFNEQLDELSRVIKYQGLQAPDWHFDRLSIGRVVDSLPPDVPGRESIVTRLWTMVSDIERAAASRDVDEQIEEVREALENGDLKSAEKALATLRGLVTESPSRGTTALMSEFESDIKKLQSAKLDEKQSAAFQKLLDKADKLAFQQEGKKAVKAYQECLFWLSRNDLPDKDRVQSEVEQKLRALQTDRNE